MDIKRIENLGNEEYHNSERWSGYISSTQLKMYLKSPLVYRHSLDNPTEQTDSMRLGSVFHSLMEHCARAHGNFAEAMVAWLGGIEIFYAPTNPKTDKPYGTATKAYAEAKDAFYASHADKTIVTSDEYDTVIAMCSALLNHKSETSVQVCKLLKWAREAEVSYFLTDDEGIKLKVRPDLLTNGKLVDWKTTSGDLDEESVVRAIIKYRYDVSLSMYQHAIHEATGKWLVPILVFVQSKPPHDCIMADISEWCYRYDAELDMVSAGIGAMEFRNLLDIHTRCVRENNWPGAESLLPSEDNVKILKPLVPHWFEKKYFEE